MEFVFSCAVFAQMWKKTTSWCSDVSGYSQCYLVHLYMIMTQISSWSEQLQFLSSFGIPHWGKQSLTNETRRINNFLLPPQTSPSAPRVCSHLPVVLDSLSLNDQRAFISRESGRRCQPFQSSRPPLCHPDVLFHHPALSLSFSFSFSFSCLICFAVSPSNTHIQQHNRQPLHLSASNSRIWKSKTKDGMLTSSSLVLRKNEDRTL